jgi:hypothetical protein
MRFYKQPHAFYAGIDRHARTMFTHILDHAGNTVVERRPLNVLPFAVWTKRRIHA